MSRWSATERLPLEPLARLVGHDDDRLRRQLRISSAQLARARRLGVTAWTADVWSARADLHPAEVWGDDWAFAIDHEIAIDISVPSARL